MALVGNLRDLKLPSLIQLNCMEKNTAKLTIENEGKYGFIYFETGQVVHAEFYPEIGEEAVYKLLTLYSGNFKVESGIRPPINSITTPWNNLLLEGLHQIDHDENSSERHYDRLFERLLAVRGVEAVIVLDTQGKIIASSSGTLEDKQYLFALTMLETENFSAEIGIDKPDFISIAGTPDKYIFTLYKEYFIVMKLQIKIKMDVVLPFIKQAIK